jgi:pyruvate/2-oxoglutarate dehydrogenase complex dihydrolipoamide acyltransferase (E2) component
MKHNSNHTIRSFPCSRFFTMDTGRLGLRKHHVKALIEIDVTDSRRKIRRIQAQTGKTVSFTSWILKCIAQAIDEHKQVHALRKGRNRLVIFNTVDLSILVEKEVDGVLVPLPLVLRDVAGRSLNDIYNEIDAAKRKIIENANDYVIEHNRKNGMIRLYSLMPQFIRLIIWKIMLRNPYRVKRMMGTAVVTSVGMMGKMDGWIMPYSIHPVCFALGSIVKKPGLKKNKPAIRDFLKMTILIDHDVIDGAPAARFVAKLAEYIESGYAL